MHSVRKKSFRYSSNLNDATGFLKTNNLFQDFETSSFGHVPITKMLQRVLKRGAWRTPYTWLTTHCSLYKLFLRLGIPDPHDSKLLEIWYQCRIKWFYKFHNLYVSSDLFCDAQFGLTKLFLRVSRGIFNILSNI